VLTPQHLTRLGILPDLSVAPERAAQKSSSSGSLREQMLVGTVCFMCLENVCAFGIPHPCSCGRETRRVRVGTSGYEWVRVGTSGHEWVRVGASGYEWVRVGTSGCEWVRIGIRVGASGCEWVRVGTSGFEWVRVGTSGYEWVRVGTSGYEDVVCVLAKSVVYSRIAYKSFLRVVTFSTI
jgi:hypothetical protein